MTGDGTNDEFELDAVGSLDMAESASAEVEVVTNQPAGYSGKSRDFEYADTEYLSVAADGTALDINGAQDLTIVFWVRFETVGPSDCLAGIWNLGAASRQYSIWIDSGGDLGFFLSNLGSDTVSAAATAPGAGTWHHVAGLYDASETDMFLYVDGGCVATNTSAPASIYNGDGAFVIGATDGTTSYSTDGMIDEVAVFNRLLTPAEITEIYTYGIDGSNGAND